MSFGILIIVVGLMSGGVILAFLWMDHRAMERRREEGLAPPTSQRAGRTILWILGSVWVVATIAFGLTLHECEQGVKRDTAACTRSCQGSCNSCNQTGCQGCTRSNGQGCNQPGCDNSGCNKSGCR